MKKFRIAICLTALLMAALLMSGCLSPLLAIITDRLLFSQSESAPAASAAPVQTPSPEPGSSASPDTQPSQQDYFEPVSPADINFEDIELIHYDTTEFFARVEEYRALGDTEGDEAYTDLIETYEWLYNELLTTYTQYTLVNILFDINPQDADLEEEYHYYDLQLTDMLDAIASASRDILSGPHGEALKQYFGEDMTEALLDYEDMTPRERELNERETALTTSYYNLLSDDSACSVTVRGTEYTFESLDEAYYQLEYAEYVKIYYMLEARLNELLGEIYVELVSIRFEQAELDGYDSFADYAYENIYYRDYTTDEARVFEEAVKAELAPAFFEQVYSNDRFWDDVSVGSFSTERLLEIVREYGAGISDEALEAFDYMVDHNMYYMENNNIMTDAGYTTSFDEYGAPFIYNHTYNSYRDVSDTAHEFGHYLDAYYHPTENVLLSGSCYDTFEVHSTSMECLVNLRYDEIYGGAGELLQTKQLADTLYSVVMGCIFDEFQQYVYSNPGLSLDEINQAYYDITEAYGMDHSTVNHDYYWMYVPHNFESPMYYISYATSALTALDIWSTALNDYDAAVDKYLTFVAKGAYDMGYLEILETSGFGTFMDDGYVASVTDPVMERVLEGFGS